MSNSNTSWRSIHISDISSYTPTSMEHWFEPVPLRIASTSTLSSNEADETCWQPTCDRLTLRRWRKTLEIMTNGRIISMDGCSVWKNNETRMKHHGIMVQACLVRANQTRVHSWSSTRSPELQRSKGDLWSQSSAVVLPKSLHFVIHRVGFCGLRQRRGDSRSQSSAVVCHPPAFLFRQRRGNAKKKQ